MTEAAGRPSATASSSAIRATWRECDPVYGLLASTTSAKAEAIRSMSSSSDSRIEPPGSRANVRVARSGAGRSSSRPRPQATSRASTTSGSYQVPRRSLSTRIPSARPRVETNTSRPWQAARIRAAASIAGPRRPRGWPPPSQCSWRSRIAAPTGSPKPALRAIDAALAAQLLDLALDTRPGQPDVDQAPDPERKRLAVGQAPDGERGVGQDAALGGGLATLEGDVVVAEQAGDGRGVARAAGILEQGRAVQGLALRLGQAERVGQAHRQVAGPQGVAGQLALGQVGVPSIARRGFEPWHDLPIDNPKVGAPGRRGGAVRHGRARCAAVEVPDAHPVDRLRERACGA